jgi:hypothetical protein
LLLPTTLKRNNSITLVTMTWSISSLMMKNQVH